MQNGRIDKAMGSFFVILLPLHLFLRTGWGDDAAFAGESMPTGEFLAFRYRKWSSRVIIEAGVRLFSAAPQWVWKSCNILMILLLVWITADLFGRENKGSKTEILPHAAFFLMLWCLPVLSLCDAGWIATTLNYLWPLTFGLVAMRPLKHWIRNEKCPPWEYPVCPACIIVSANTEQGAAVLLGVYLLFGIYLLWAGRKPAPFYVVLLLFIAVSIVFILTAPGNVYRYAAEVERWFPGYDRLSLFQKLLMGFIDSVNYYASAGGSERTNYLFALLTGILFAGVWQKRKEQRFSAMAVSAVIPFAFYWGVGQFANARIAAGGFARGGHIAGLFGKNRCLPTGAGAFDYLGWISYPWKMVFLQAGVYLGLLFCVGMTIWFLHGKSFETLLELTVLGTGLSSRVMMGFSPTIYASGERTSLYCSVAILIVCLRNLQICWNGQIGDGQGGMRGKVLLGVYIAGVACLSIWGSKLALDGRMRLFFGG